MTSKKDGKITLPEGKMKGTIKLASGLNKEDILKKLGAKTEKMGFIIRKGEGEKQDLIPEDSGLSYTEKQRRMKAIQNQNEAKPDEIKIKEKAKPKTLRVEEEAVESIENMKEEIQNTSENIAPSISTDSLKTKIVIQQKEEIEEKKKPSVEAPIFSFKQGESILNLDEFSKTEAPVKVDKRDKSLIEKTMMHYKYLEFDNEKEIKELQKGLELRQALEEKRKANTTSNNIDEDSIIITSASSDSEEEVIKIRREAYFSRHNKRSGKKKQSYTKFLQKEVEIYDKNIVLDVARNLAIKVEDFIKRLRNYGINASENSLIDGDSAELIIEEMGHIAKRVKRLTAEDKIKKQSSSNLKPVAPVVTIMGHVDHGKTSLLDAIREEDVAEKEAGGITQHIGAYQTTLKNGKKITFIDTPGHEAFTAIRSRGANVTHVIVLVVAADDGVMPQTIEAIKHAKEAKVPIVVAVNKIDKPNADVNKVKNALLAFELVSEDLGGDVIFVPVSAKLKQNLDKLCDAIILQSEIFDARAEFEALASGTVLEGKVDKQKGIIATLLVQNGTLKVGDIVVMGSVYGKVRLMINDKKQEVKTAEPSTPIEVYGLNEVPEPGFLFNVVENEKLAKEIVAHRKEKKNELNSGQKKLIMESFLKPKEQKKQVNIVIKADVQSTIEAIKYSINQIKMPSEIEVKIMQASVGSPSESDVTYAKNYNAIIFAFSVKVGNKEEEFAKKQGVSLKQHSIIYNIIDDLKEIISSQLSPIIKDEIIGEVEVKAIFDIMKSGKIAGSVVRKGLAKRNAIVKVIRSGNLISEGKLKTLKHFKEDVKELAQGNECGIQIEGFEDFAVGDLLQIIERTEEKRVI